MRDPDDLDEVRGGARGRGARDRARPGLASRGRGRAFHRKAPLALLRRSQDRRGRAVGRRARDRSGAQLVLFRLDLRRSDARARRRALRGQPGPAPPLGGAPAGLARPEMVAATSSATSARKADALSLWLRDYAAT